MNRRLACIVRLLEHDSYIEFKDWLIENKFANEDQFKVLSRPSEKAQFIYEVLEQAAQAEKLILLDYEWSILPLELIKITCVTLNESKEFTHGY